MFRDDYGLTLIGYLGSLLLTVVLAIIGLALFIRQADHWYQKKYCEPKLSALSRQGKFAEYNHWDYACLVRVGDGTYVPLDKITNTKD